MPWRPTSEEEIWLASQKSARTRRAYKQDLAYFMRTFGITAPEQLRQVDHRAVMAWERIMREHEGAAASTVRRGLAALSSLFKHLVRQGGAGRNPVVDVQRPSLNKEEGSTAAFSKAQARRLLDAPRPTPWRGCAIAPSCPSGYAARRSRRSSSATCIKTVGSMRCG